MTRGRWLFDYTGGLDDLAARKVRFIGEPDCRIAEDYLRILRFFRFSAEFGEGPLDPEGRAAALRLRDGLARLSRERVRAELLKLLCARRAPEVCGEMSGDGLLHVLVASVPDPERLRRVIAISSGSPEDPLLRLAALCVRLPEDAARLREQLRLSNEETERLEAAGRALVSLYGRGGPPAGLGLQALLFRFGRQAATDGLVLAQADDYPGNASLWEQARKCLAATVEPQFPFSGADLVARGISEGPAIGVALKELETEWIKAGFPTDRALLDRLLEGVLRKRHICQEGEARRKG
jgi:poly(A) polymerase